MHPYLTTEQRSYTVSEINEHIRVSLESQFPMLKILGELANVTHAASGHVYFTLKDEQAQLRCIMFRKHHLSLSTPLRNGMEVSSYGQLTLYKTRGDFQLRVISIQARGVGDLQQAFEALRRQLEKQGLFDVSHKKSIPTDPQTVGLITSPYGAALHDLLTVLRRRAPHLRVILYPAQVQGERAAAEIVQMISAANQRQECDLLILARGGGSAEDLAAFNDAALAQAIFRSCLPIITGIGHETNISIADLVADLRAPTPSAAAEQITAHMPRWPEQLRLAKARLHRACRAKLIHARQLLYHKQSHLKHPKEKLKAHAQRLAHLKRQLLLTQVHALQRQRQRFSLQSQRLDTLSPLSTLNRGYAIVSDAANRIIRDAKHVAPKQILTVHLARGKLRVQYVPMLATIVEEKPPKDG